jgi:hypothetical protein
MKPLPGIVLGVIAVTGLVAIWPRGAIVAQPTQRPIARLVKVTGEVSLKSYTQKSDSDWRSASSGAILRYGDLLKVPPNANAIIECLSNPSIRRIVPDDGIPWGVASACPPTR